MASWNTYGRDAQHRRRDEVEATRPVAVEAGLDVLHELAPDRFQRVDTECRPGDKQIDRISPRRKSSPLNNNKNPHLLVGTSPLPSANTAYSTSSCGVICRFSARSAPGLPRYAARTRLYFMPPCDSLMQSTGISVYE